MSLRRRLAAFLAHPDERVATGNLIAAVLGWNTPLYPLWVRLAAGPEAWPAGFLTLCVLPFFLAVPPLAASRPFAARLLLCAVGLANVLFCTWVFGPVSGTELFLLPCILLPGLVLDRAEWPVLLPLIAAPVVAYLVLHGRYPPPPLPFPPEIGARLFTLNAGSVAGLIAFFALLAARPRG